mmetsp:Transcript_21349/g.39061  ORF Transcript_21349/g.39061 Transcript_21349/m.39061 type:complete len:393 (+) Transcript_21349:132-1310(+)
MVGRWVVQATLIRSSLLKCIFESGFQVTHNRECRVSCVLQRVWSTRGIRRVGSHLAEQRRKLQGIARSSLFHRSLRIEVLDLLWNFFNLWLDLCQLGWSTLHKLDEVHDALIDCGQSGRQEARGIEVTQRQGQLDLSFHELLHVGLQFGHELVFQLLHDLDKGILDGFEQIEGVLEGHLEQVMSHVEGLNVHVVHGGIELCINKALPFTSLALQLEVLQLSNRCWLLLLLPHLSDLLIRDANHLLQDSEVPAELGIFGDKLLHSVSFQRLLVTILNNHLNLRNRRVVLLRAQVQRVGTQQGSDGNLHTVRPSHHVVVEVNCTEHWGIGALEGLVDTLDFNLLDVPDLKLTVIGVTGQFRGSTRCATHAAYSSKQGRIGASSFPAALLMTKMA